MAETFTPQKYSPLSDLPAPVAGITLEERVYLAKVNVRADPENPVLMAGFKQALGIELPVTANTTQSNERYTVFWLGPNEWLIHGQENTQAEIVAALRKETASEHVAVTDVSDYYMVLRLTGDKAREVLSKGTPFDVHPKVFGPGACAQTCFGHASILLHCADPSPVFDLQVRWSFAEYLWMYLREAAQEYG